MVAPKRRNISQRSELIYDAHAFGIIIDTRELFVSPRIDADSGEAEIDHTTAHQFIRNLQILNSIGQSPILAHFITCGGDYSYGMAMYDAIKLSKSSVITLSYAHARSMSSIIPQAAKWRVITPNAHCLIHFGTLSVDGNCISSIAEAEQAKKENEVMLDIYTSRCKEGNFFKRGKMSEKQVKEWLRENMEKKQEFYMTPNEAVDYGLMDAVLGDKDFETIEKLRQDV